MYIVEFLCILIRNLEKHLNCQNLVVFRNNVMGQLENIDDFLKDIWMYIGDPCWDENLYE